MNNRISCYAATSPHKDLPPTCGFCGCPYQKTSHFFALSKEKPLMALCGECIARLGRLSRLSRLVGIFGSPRADKWKMLEIELLADIEGQEGSAAAKRQIAMLAVSLAKRSAALLCGSAGLGLKQCIHTGVSLAPPRIGIVAWDWDSAYYLLARAIGVVGMPIVRVLNDQASVRVGIERLTKLSNWDVALFPNSVLWIDGVRDENPQCTLICSAQSCGELPAHFQVLDLREWSFME